MIKNSYVAQALRNVPDTFLSIAEYSEVFEPLLISECWAHIVQAKESFLKEDAVKMTLNKIVSIDHYHGKR